ncbi:MAG TPA: 1,4-alpha-glucan branching protein domain-containing protein [Candidatus Polarisedimenticolia bacterium]|nr:1,4-alpha-glucan branching protein domain-containing protein [Candidatus Polarisedimenticolia bacterium]
MPLSEKIPPADPLPPLPAPGGPARATLLLVRPRLLFLYWVRDAELDAALVGAPGPAGLRLDRARPDGTFEEVEQVGFDFRAAGWYLPNRHVDAMLRARLGVATIDGFRTLLTSNSLRVPRERAGEGPVREGLRPRDHAAGQVEIARTGPDLPYAGSPAGRDLWRVPPPGGVAREGRHGGAPEAPRAAGDLAVVLHAHLPFVRHPERDFFLEEQWLFEAITETYLPLLDGFDHLLADRIPTRLTMSLTATLMAMLRDPVLMGKYERWLGRICDLAGREVARTRRDPDFGPVAGFYRDRLERLLFLFVRKYRRDLVGRFALLQEEGLLEIIACAATHGFLPHLASAPESVRAQIAIGVAEHRRQLGRAPRGIWLPECAYYEGLDSLLARSGLEYCFVDAHAVRNASSPPRHGLHAPLHTPAGVAFFGRDEECSAQVWSAEQGYPGDPSYRDFYRDIGFDLEHADVAPWLDPSGARGMTGLKYHRITGRSDHKEPYRRDAALRTVARHAADFVAKRRLQIERLAPGMDRPPLLLAMYDAELFGHWWFEGPEWLEGVLRRLPEQGVCAVSPGQYLDGHPAGQTSEPSSSSWGAGGYYEVWLNGTNDWIVPPLHDAGRRMTALASRDPGGDPLGDRALRQAGRELLLAQASDWPFILHNRTTVQYATRRVHEHLDRFDRLARQIEAGSIDEAALSRLEAIDNLLPEIDPGIWRSA